jgi:hypothetical protein
MGRARAWADNEKAAWKIPRRFFQAWEGKAQPRLASIE